MVAKRTQREIRRMSALTNVIFDCVKKLGPGIGRHSAFMAAVKKHEEFESLPEWRKYYLQGVAEGSSAVLAMLDAGQIEGVAKATAEASKTVTNDLVPPPPVRAPNRPTANGTKAPAVRPSKPPPAPRAHVRAEPAEENEPSDQELLIWMARTMRAAMKGQGQAER